MKNADVYRALGVDVDAPRTTATPPPGDQVVTDFDGGVRTPAPAPALRHEQYLGALLEASRTGQHPDRYLPPGHNFPRTGDPS